MGDGDRRVEGRDGVGIFRPAIDEALGRPDGEAGDHHALDQDEGIALHQHAVGEGAGIALVRIADDVFPIGLRLGDGLPFDAGREPAPPRPRRPESVTSLTIAVGSMPTGALQPGEAPGRAIIGHRQGIDDAAAGEGQALLAGEPGNGVGRAEIERGELVLRRDAVEEARGDERRNVFGGSIGP